MPLRNDQNPKMSVKNSNSNIVVLNFITYIDNLKFNIYLYELSKQEAKRASVRHFFPAWSTNC